MDFEFTRICDLAPVRSGDVYPNVHECPLDGQRVRRLRPGNGNHGYETRRRRGDCVMERKFGEVWDRESCLGDQRANLFNKIGGFG